MADALCRALRGIKTIEGGEPVWKMPGDELTIDAAEAADLSKAGYLEILAVDEAEPADAGEQGAEGKAARRGK
ncbi:MULTISPECIES: hypothetical protein [Methylobacterium]|uniref:hypothetical protein n=1 Tax=Methylobacterium TaxID=407 RepID=UPI00272E0101|nr:hypothetical protein [Methylobacterium sp.]